MQNYNTWFCVCFLMRWSLFSHDLSHVSSSDLKRVSPRNLSRDLFSLYFGRFPRPIFVTILLPDKILVRENEEFSPPRRRLRAALQASKSYGCGVYLILMTNGMQVANMLMHIEEYSHKSFSQFSKILDRFSVFRDRLINAQGKFILMHDFRLFHKEMRYLWNRIINVVFLRHHVEYKRRPDGPWKKREWYDVETVRFPARVKGLVVTHYMDTWFSNRFRYGTNHFKSKTKNLKGKKVK